MRFPIILRSAMEMAARMSWRLAALLAGLHFMISWLGLSLIGEDVAGSVVSMLYFYVTTATTVGYGDLSPEGDAGRLFTNLCPSEDVPVRHGDLIHYISASQHAGFDIAGMAVAQGME